MADAVSGVTRHGLHTTIRKEALGRRGGKKYSLFDYYSVANER